METKDPSLRTLKITTVGDGSVGKTSLLITYTTSRFPVTYIPTVFDNYSCKITVDGEVFNMSLWDTAGQEDYGRLRPLSYPDTNCFILCYSIGSRRSYDNITVRWFPEVKYYCSSTPIILVGTQSDLRISDARSEADRAIPLITTSEGRMLSEKINAVFFVECSSLKCKGLKEVMEAAVRASVQRTIRKKRYCHVL